MPQQTSAQRTEDLNGINMKTRYKNNNNQNNNNNNNYNQQQQQQRNGEQTRDTANCEFRVEGAAAGSQSVKTPIVQPAPRASPPVYENVQFDLRLSQQLLLRQFFRHNRAQPDAIYENLCRGCGYGVFEAHGQLCHFCACIVNGLKRPRPQPQTAHCPADSAENIYENICAKCGALYSSDDCEHCLKVDDTPPPPAPQPPPPEKRAANLSKSTSFSKRGLFYGLIGSLKRSVKTPPSTPPRKHLQIVHNVDGYENVFRTQETFDLQRICELKSQRLALNSRSDQHIYGRLKCSDVLAASAQTLPAALTQSQSHDQLLLPASSADSLLDDYTLQPQPELGQESGAKKAASAHKRRRISKPRLLRSRSQNDTNQPTTTPTPPAKLSLYLADSVCHWLTWLRRDVHSYRAPGSPLDDDEQLGLCQPKSVPAKNPLIYCATAASSGPLAPSVHGDKTPASSRQLADCDNCDIAAKEQPAGAAAAAAISPAVARMVRDFKRNLMAKQMQQQQQQQEQEQHNQRPTELIESLSAAAPRSPRSPRSPVAAAEQRAKRQAIYLQIDNNNHEPNNNNNNDDANVNCSPIRNRTTAATITTTATPFTDEAIGAAAGTAELGAVGEQRLAASRSAARQAITAATSKWSGGINERDSEFVSDILSAFDDFLQRASDPTEADTDITAEVSSDEHDHVVAAAAHSERSGAVVTTAPQPSDEEDVALIDNDEPGDDQLTPPPQPHWTGTDARTPNAIAQLVDIVQLLGGLQISRSLNTLVIFYDKPLRFFLQRAPRSLTRERLAKRFRRFCALLDATACEGAPDSGDCAPHSSVALVGAAESAGPLGAPRNGSARVAVAVVRRANAQIVVKRVSLIEAGAASEVEGPRVSHAGVDSAASVDADSRRSAVMKSSSDEVVLRPKAKDAARRNEKALGKFIESVDDDAQVRELCEPKRDAKCAPQPAPAANAICAAGEAIERSPSAASRHSNRAPQVPARDPKTSLSSTTAAAAAATKTEAPRERNSPLPLSAKSESRVKNPKNSVAKMTVPTAAADSKASPKPAHNNNNNNNNNHSIDSNNTKNGQQQQRDVDESEGDEEEEEEDIYQPIWQFKTVGEVQERYQTDVDYYDVSSLAAISATAAAAKLLRCNDSSSPSSVLISDNVEDHGEWETDDEFMFSTQPVECDDGYSLSSSTMRSTGSAASTAASASMSASPSASGSTVTGFESGSSTATLASAISASLQHPLLRSVGIFYSLLEPKLRAIVYDYDRVHAPLYFARRMPTLAADDSGIERSPQPPPRTTSAAKTAAKATAPPKMQLLPDSVQAWKFMLLEVNYLEDEEDMIVSEREILRAQQIKEDIDTQAAIVVTPPQNILQRFKSASFGNLIDLPNEDDKKSIAERMRNKLQRGVFKLNVRSPKSEKKSRGIFRRTETASLYLEDGLKPKYPIFGAPLEQLELNESTHPHVPRLVVDCIELIERKDCILQDGLYRASGNKISIDELKQKLSESYIYDPKLLASDDIHTLTSLLKLFFRELGAPLIPQSTYDRFGAQVSDAPGIESLRLAIDQMLEPNRATLQFLVRHLKNVAACSAENRMPASNLAIVWGPCIFSANQLDFVDIGRMNTLAKVLIENYERIFGENERLVS